MATLHLCKFLNTVERMSLHTGGLNAALRERMFEKHAVKTNESANTFLYFDDYYEGKYFLSDK